MSDSIKKYYELKENDGWTRNTTLDKLVKIQSEKDEVVRKVRSEMLIRSAKGLNKYGTTMSENDLSLKQWLQHAKEEAMDLALYLQRAIDEIDGTEPKQNSNSNGLTDDEYRDISFAILSLISSGKLLKDYHYVYMDKKTGVNVLSLGENEVSGSPKG